ncbi:uncharacterized protein LOC124366203 isoform X2 [Homalodisca vitripennis]|uniref:uncharacterized protein LOC124366203 isoform X1 n=1 Tax=Homalodisca vitripennis TaxID=197043 RepID=UPI001EEBFD8F|nr:uncharacterized protein LOC124366203 isoform X1 [Homalodisca vitripennis]XP_046678529.1 uncharacterized protein LOC124366203 isoform X2 [Homalodisca vitripennis]
MVNCCTPGQPGVDKAPIILSLAMSSQYSVNMDVILRCLVLVLTTLVAFTAGSATTATTSTSQDMDTGRVAGHVGAEHCRPCTPCEVCQPRQVEVAKPQECKKSYLLIDERSSWYEAMAGCKMRGQRLATINNIEEWNQVKREITLKTSVHRSHTYWTAGMGIKSIGFVWASTWEQFNFTSWRDGEPRFLGNIYCVAIDWIWSNQHEYDWITRMCSFTKYFICEKCLNQ